eukprot:3452694-Prymnesium_polylepis.1
MAMPCCGCGPLRSPGRRRCGARGKVRVGPCRRSCYWAAAIESAGDGGARRWRVSCQCACARVGPWRSRCAAALPAAPTT